LGGHTSIRIFPAFERTFSTLIKKTYPNSINDIDEAIKRVVNDPYSGTLIRGFGGIGLWKIRIGLPSYRLSARKGLRLIYFYDPFGEDILVPVYIYAKTKYPGEKRYSKPPSANSRKLSLKLRGRKP